MFIRGIAPLTVCVLLLPTAANAQTTFFTPTGGMWEGTWAGVMQTNCDLELSIAGYGSGASIDGWRLAETLIRTNASAPIDSNVPYFFTGTIKSPPVGLGVDIYDNVKPCPDGQDGIFPDAENHLAIAVLVGAVGLAIASSASTPEASSGLLCRVEFYR